MLIAPWVVRHCWRVFAHWAIANSSGFKGWKQQQSPSLTASSLDKQVRLYLRETLETLAY